MPTALLDLSMLGTNTRTRSIGRYISDLAVSLGAAPQTTTDMRVLGIERLGVMGGATVTHDLAGAVARLTDPHQRAIAHADWAYRVRLLLAGAARRAAPDLVHTGHPNATPLGELGCPRVTTCHDLIPLRFPRHYLGWRDGYRPGREKLDLRRYAAADHIIAVSETTASDLVELLDIRASKITVVHNGVDLERWQSEPGEHDQAVREGLGLSQASYVLCVGAANWRKNPEGALEALAKARARLADQDLVLVWAARLGSESRAKLQRQARALGIAGALRMIGYVSDTELAALYRGAVAQLFVSRAEGFGYPIVEAMATGCPVITSNISSMAEIAGDAAILVDPENIEAIAEGIVALARDDDERRRFAQLGVLRARQFALEHMANKTLDVYRDVIARRGR